jgi:hypothetical protein
MRLTSRPGSSGAAFFMLPVLENVFLEESL